MTVVACLKWLTPHDGDDRFGGISPADSSALEWAFRLGEARGEQVVAITVGPAPAEAALRSALACGASRAIRIDTSDESFSSDVAAALAGVISGFGADGHSDANVDGKVENNVSFVCCGDYSLDRGSGSVPAFIAAQLGARQALGLVEVVLVGANVSGLRRLDGGRRERLHVEAPAVVSVEGATATLRRAPLSGALRSQNAVIQQIAGPSASHLPTARSPYRPRPRVLPPPQGVVLDRLKSLLSGGADSGAKSHGVPVELEPAQAAERIIVVLRDWGYLA